MFENYPKCRICIFQFWHFPPIFVRLKVTCLVTLFDCKLQVFKNSSKLTNFGFYNEVLSKKYLISIFEFWHFPPFFVQLELTWLVTLFDRQLPIFKNSPKWTNFGLARGVQPTLSNPLLYPTKK